MTLIGADGKPVPPPPPKPSDVQRWAKLTDADRLLGDALIHFGKGANWFDIYSALECLVERFGKGKKKKEKESTFLDLNWELKHQLKSLKQTANRARHAEHRYKPPKDPMSLEDAYALLGRLLHRALREVSNAGPSRK